MRKFFRALFGIGNPKAGLLYAYVFAAVSVALLPVLLYLKVLIESDSEIVYISAVAGGFVLIMSVRYLAYVAREVLGLRNRWAWVIAVVCTVLQLAPVVFCILPA